MDDKPIEIEIYLRSGTVVRVHAREMTVKRNGLIGELLGLEWVSVPDSDEFKSRVLHYICLQDVSAIVYI